MTKPLPQNAALPHWAPYSFGLGGLALWVALLAGCKALPTPKHDTAPSAAFVVQTAPAPSAKESYCAWYGDARDGVLCFGESAFWSAMRAAGATLAQT